MTPGSVPSTERHSAPGSAATTTVTRCLIYTRVSKDKSGRQRSPEEQLGELRPVAEAHGWALLPTLTDAIGATRHTRKERAGWPAVLDAIRAGQVDVLLVWEASRLTRNEREYADFADLCETAGTKVAVAGHVYDLTEPMDRLILGQLINFAAFEAGMTRKRSKRGIDANLVAGRPAGKVLYGYRRVRDKRSGALLGQEPDPVTAAVVREVFARVANGESIRSVQLDLTRRRVPPGGGRLTGGEVRPWPRTTLGNMLRNRSYLGHRTHGGKVVVENAWPAIVAPELFERVQALIGDPSRRKSQDVRVKHLLAGLIRCEVCGGRVTYRTQHCRNAAYYGCKDGGHVNAAAHRLEQGVRELLVTWLSAPDALDTWAHSDIDTAGLAAELKALEARLADVEDAVKAGEMSARMAGGVERDLTPRIEEITATLGAARAEVPAPVAAMAGEHAAEWWDGAAVETRRTLIRATLRDAELRRSPTRTHRTDLGLRFRWAGKRLYEV